MKPLARTDRILTEDLVHECVVYDNVRRKAHSLNRPVTWIWRHCDGLTTVEEMAVCFEQEFRCENSMDLIVSGLQQLTDADLLASPIDDQNISRRSVIAVGSVLAPVIASITVPPAAAAKSTPKPPKPPKPPKGKS